MAGTGVTGFFSKLLGGAGGGDSLALNAFGKLPIYKDFISVGMTDPAAQEFREWISSGFSKKWSVRDEYRGTVIPPYSFLLRLPGTGRYVAGSIWGSHDEGGLRQFPFTVFSVLPEKGPLTDVVLALDYLSLFEHRGSEIRRNYQSSGALKAFYSAHRAVRIDVAVKSPDEIEASLRDALEHMTLGEFVSSAPGLDSPQRWRAFTSRFLTAIEDSEKYGGGAIRIPLGERLRPSGQMLFWLLWSSTRLGRTIHPSGVLFQSRTYEAGRGVFFYRELRPDDFLLLHPANCDYDYVEEITGDDGREGAGQSPAFSSAEPVDPNDGGFSEPLILQIRGSRS